MLKYTIIIAGLFFSTSFLNAQTEFQDKKGNTHLWGAFELDKLQTAPFDEWYKEQYNKFTTDLSKVNWAENLENYQIDIYLGTWCGDSKKWVPRFIKMWEELGLDHDQIHFIGLHRNAEFRKQGPNGEEKGKGIHRVPTFIFSQDGVEQARIVESPKNDLVTDVQQIALGCPSVPRYRAVVEFQNQFASQHIDSLIAHPKPLLRAVHRKTSGEGELNTYGYVLKSAGKMEQALLVFRINNFIHKHSPNTFDSLGEQYFDMENFQKAKECYQSVLKIDAENEHAAEMLKKLELK